MRTALSVIVLLVPVASLVFAWPLVQNNATKTTMAEDYGALAAFFMLLIVVGVNASVFLTSVVLLVRGKPNTKIDCYGPIAACLCSLGMIVMAGWQLFVRN